MRPQQIQNENLKQNNFNSFIDLQAFRQSPIILYKSKGFVN